MAGNEREPVVRRPFRILAVAVAAVCFVLAAWFALGPDWRDSALRPFLFLACGVVTAGLALTGNTQWRGSKRAEPGSASGGEIS